MSLEADIRGARLVVVGNLNRDLRTEPIGRPRRLLADGETAVGGIRATIGGGGANSAAGAAALGAQVTLVARVGRDALGDGLESALRASGVRTRLARSRTSPTGTSLALSQAGGARHFVSCLPSSRELSDADVPDAALARQHHLLRADIWFSEPMLFGGNARLFARARAKGLGTSLDLNWDPCWGHARSAEVRRRIGAVRAVLPLVDLAHGNERELCAITHAPSLARALATLTRSGAGAVVVHLGSRGAGWWDGARLTVAPPARASRIVHEAGTGDLLSAAMMALARSSAPVEARLRHSNRLVAAYMEGRLYQPAAIEAISA